MEFNEGVFKINGRDYRKELLDEHGLYCLSLAIECQEEIGKTTKRLDILKIASKALIATLEQKLNAVETNSTRVTAQGTASKDIPQTTAEVPEEKPAEFPANLPEELRIN